MARATQMRYSFPDARVTAPLQSRLMSFAPDQLKLAPARVATPRSQSVKLRCPAGLLAISSLATLVQLAASQAIYVDQARVPRRQAIVLPRFALAFPIDWTGRAPAALANTLMQAPRSAPAVAPSTSAVTHAPTPASGSAVSRARFPLQPAPAIAAPPALAAPCVFSRALTPAP